MTGIGYNPKKTGRKLTSVNDLFDPKFKGRVSMFTESRDSAGLVLLGHGQEPDDGDDRRLLGGDREDRRGEPEGPDPRASPATTTRRT